METYNEARELEDKYPKIKTLEIEYPGRFSKQMNKWRGLLPPVICNTEFCVETLKSFLKFNRQLNWWQNRNNYSGYCYKEIYLI